MKFLLTFGVVLLFAGTVLAQGNVYLYPDTIYTKPSRQAGTWYWSGEVTIVNLSQDTLVLLEPRQVINTGQVIVAFDSARVGVGFNTGNHFPNSPRGDSWGIFIRRQNAATGFADSISLMIVWRDTTAPLAVPNKSFGEAKLSGNSRHIELEFPDQHAYDNFHVFDVMGRIINAGVILEQRLTIKDLSSGTYFIVCEGQNRRTYKHTIRK